MAALGVASGIAGLITLVQGTIPWIQDCRHEERDRNDFERRFRCIESDLQSIQARFTEIEKEFPLQVSPSKTFGSLHQNDRTFVRTRAMCQADGEFPDLKRKLDRICIKAKYEGRTKLKSVKDHALWTWKKARFEREQQDIVFLLERIRNKLSDDSAQLSSETLLLVRKLGRSEEESRVLVILDWICSDSLENPPFPVPAAATKNHSFVSSRTYKQWRYDAKWQLNNYGEPGCGKASSSSVSLRIPSAGAD